ncbi:MAG: Chromate transport protein ChrA [Myxococcaceae bacterium]|nr:Chromate transport protein ChrA [Myxococcaceae bacterium]
MNERAIEQPTSLRELALLFLRLGATAFGGPAAHIALMRIEVVERRRWLTDPHFLDLLSAANLIPGPNSTELAIHIGWQRRRWAGLVVAGVSFIVPAMLITGALGWAYLHFGARPELGFLLYGIKPVIVAVVVQAIWGLTPKAASNAWLRWLGAAVLVLSACAVDQLLLLLGAGTLTVLRARLLERSPKPDEGEQQLALSPLLPVAALSASSLVTLPSLFWVFFKVGSVLFGSGYVLIAFLRTDLVQRLHWLTEAQLIDAVAIGQLTPGPVFTTATFIGYLLRGSSGALVATLGIFLPAFLFVALSGPLVPRLRASRVTARFLDGVNVASLALMAVATAQLARVALVDVPTLALALLGSVLLLRFGLGSTWLIALGAASGWLLRGLRG